MGQYPALAHLSIGTLIAAAGGDPWHLDDTIQAGDPGEIDKLAQVFHSARANTAEADAAFLKARQRFENSWNRQTGAHPINDSAEVQSVVANVKDQIGQLDQIAADLEAVAASLAETQRFSALDLQIADSQLQVTDAFMGQAQAAGQDTSAIEKAAEGITKQTLDEITALQNGYKAALAQSVVALRNDGYDPVDLSGIDDDGKPTPEQNDQNAVNQYGAGQRARDEALVNSGGPMTPEKAAAAARLRDYATATGPASDPMSRHLASERLDDYNKANFNGPLTERDDPVLGGTFRDRAATRLQLQQALESGKFGAPMTPDQATAELDQSEHLGRVLTTQGAIKALQNQGMSLPGAQRAVGDLYEGMSLKDLISNSSTGIGATGSSLYGAGKSVPIGAHALGGWSAADAEAIKGIGDKLGYAGLGIDSVLGLYDVLENGAPVGKTVGEVAGSFGGGYLAGVGAWALAGSEIGPEGAAVTGLIGALVLSKFGKEVGGWAGGLADSAFSGR